MQNVFCGQARCLYTIGKQVTLWLIRSHLHFFFLKHFLVFIVIILIQAFHLLIL
jgi:hypothetical protein